MPTFRQLVLPGLLLLSGSSSFAAELPSAAPASAPVAKGGAEVVAQLTPPSGPVDSTAARPVNQQNAVLFFVSRWGQGPGTSFGFAFPFACYDRSQAKYLVGKACRALIPANAQVLLTDGRAAKLGKSTSVPSWEQGEINCHVDGYKLQKHAKPAAGDRHGYYWAVWPREARALVDMAPAESPRNPAEQKREDQILTEASWRTYRQQPCYHTPTNVEPWRDETTHMKRVWNLDLDGDGKVDSIYEATFRSDQAPSHLLLRRGRDPQHAALLASDLCDDTLYVKFEGSIDFDQDGQRELIYSQDYEGSSYFLGRLDGDDLSSANVGCLPSLN